jgi:hypothetical protein
MFFRNFVRLGFATMFLFLLMNVAASYAQSKSAAIPITVYQDPGWGCCSAWVGHLQSNGFKIDKKNVSGKQLVDVKIKNNVPQKLYSCHTATVQGYVIEGHVPADLIHRLLKEKPEVAGLAVPGMPVGSPGMEGVNPQPYEVLTFDKDGKTSIYARR